jgi:hypothetical protein
MDKLDKVAFGSLVICWLTMFIKWYFRPRSEEILEILDGLHWYAWVLSGGSFLLGGFHLIDIIK